MAVMERIVILVYLIAICILDGYANAGGYIG